MLKKNNIKGGSYMSKRIITISREFGSGGRTIGRELAQRLGWKFYDKELVNAVALETGFAEDYIEEHEITGNVKFWICYSEKDHILPWKLDPRICLMKTGSFSTVKLVAQSDCVWPKTRSTLS